MFTIYPFHHEFIVNRVKHLHSLYLMKYSINILATNIIHFIEHKISVFKTIFPTSDTNIQLSSFISTKTVAEIFPDEYI